MKASWRSGMPFWGMYLCSHKTFTCSLCSCPCLCFFRDTNIGENHKKKANVLCVCVLAGMLMHASHVMLENSKSLHDWGQFSNSCYNLNHHTVNLEKNKFTALYCLRIGNISRTYA